MNAGSRARLKHLEDELLALSEDTMLLEELDGFIAGLLVCPDLIKPGEWLPIVWDRDGEDSQPVFADLDHANKVLGLIMEHYNSVARTLMKSPSRYSPLFPIDDRNGDILWELWIEGFDKAVKLRPAAWQNLLNADAETATAIRGMTTLAEIACADRAMPQIDRDAATTTAPQNIARWVVTLNTWRITNYRPPAAASPWPPSSFRSANKAGRNDTCPCGSGKKYKKCCGLN